MVEDVEGVRAKLESVSLLPYGVFLQAHVPVLPGRSAEHVICGGPIGSVGGRPSGAVDCAARASHKRVVTGRSGKRGWIEPLRTGLVGWVKVDSGYPVGAAAYKADGAAGGGIGNGERLSGLERGDSGDLPASDGPVDEVAGPAEEGLTCANGKCIGVADNEDLWCDAGDIAARVVGICTGGVLQVFGPRDPRPLVFGVDHEAMAVLLMHADLKRVHLGVKERIQHQADRREGLDQIGILDRDANLRRVKKVDVWGDGATPAGIVLFEVVLAYVADANIQTFVELMLDGEVVLLRIGCDGGVLSGHRRIGRERSSGRERSVHRDGRN